MFMPPYDCMVIRRFPSRQDSLTCTPIDLVSHHVHFFLVVRTAKQLRVFNYILIAGAQSYTAHHADETLFVENALARAHYQFTSRYVIAATPATTINTPKTESINALLLIIFIFHPWIESLSLPCCSTNIRQL